MNQALCHAMSFHLIALLLFIAFSACASFHDRPIVLVFGFSHCDPKEFRIKPPLNEYITDFEVISQDSDENANALIRHYSPDCIVSFGPDARNFTRLMKLPQFIRSKWIHYDNIETQRNDNFWGKVSSDVLSTMVNAWLLWPHPILNDHKKSPLVSIFTPSLGGGEKLRRVARSLEKQSYDNWQWVVVVDDPDDQDTIDILEILSTKDCRIEYWRPDKKSGVIGTRKRQAAMLAKGDILVEMDHDDQLMIGALQGLVKAFASQPDVGFVYTDFSEPHWGTDLSVFATYGEDFPFHYDAWESGAPGDPPKYVRWFLATRTAPLSLETLPYLTRLPNHIRAWRADVYRQMNGHRDLIVADDHELLLRTYLTTRWMYWDKMEYLQYRNVNKNKNQSSDNFTFKRNGLIQWMRQLNNEWYERNGLIKVRDQALGPGPQHLEWGFRIQKQYPGNVTAILPVSAHDDISEIRKAFETAKVQADEVIVIFPESMSTSFLSSYWHGGDSCRLQILGVPEQTYPTRLQRAKRGWELSQSPIVAYIYPGTNWSSGRLENAVNKLIQVNGPLVWSDAFACKENANPAHIVHRRNAPWVQEENSLFLILFEDDDKNATAALNDAYMTDTCGVIGAVSSIEKSRQYSYSEQRTPFVHKWEFGVATACNVGALLFNTLWSIRNRRSKQRAKLE